MKAIRILSMAVILCILGNTQILQAQDKTVSYNNEIRFGAFQLLNNMFYISYEHLYSNFGTSFTTVLIYKDTYDESVTGYMVQLDQKIYLKNVSTDYGSIYFSPGIKYRYKEFKGSTYTDKLNTYGIQLVGGIKYVIYNRLVIDFYLGGKINNTIINKTDDSDTMYDKNLFSPGFSGILPVINCTFGFQF